MCWSRYLFILLFNLFLASGGTFLFGIGLGWSAQSNVKMYEENKFDISKNQFALAVSMFPFGAACTLILAGIIRNRFGTKLTILVFAIPSIIGWMLLIFAQNAAMVHHQLFHYEWPI
jgi:MFS family permease